MKDEIKEILDKLQKVANCETASRNALMEMKDKDYQLLLDYITNLQERNEKLDKELTHKTKQYEFIRHRDNILYYENIINEAIEHIDLYINRLLNNDITITPIEMRYLKNILKGSDDK